MKIQKKSISKPRNTVKVKKINSIKKIDLFKNKLASSNTPPNPEINQKSIILTYTFSCHSPSQEFYKNNFKKFLNSVVVTKKKPKSKIDLIPKKMPVKSLDTLIINGPFPESFSESVSNENQSLTKRVTNIFVDNKVENSYLKIDKIEITKKKNFKETFLLSSPYIHEEPNSENIFFNTKQSEDPRIALISIDILLKKFAFEDIIEFDFDITEYFIQQFIAFINFTTLMDKIRNIFNFYTKKKTFPRGIFPFLNRLITYSDEILIYDNLQELANFYKFAKRFPESLEPELKIKEVIKHLDIIINNSLTDTKLGLYNNFIEQLDKLKHPITPEKPSKYFDVIEWSELEIAKQLSLVSHFFFMKIEMKELLASNWIKQEKFILAPNVMKMVDRFNKLCNWVCEEVLSYDCKKNRAKAITKLIKIANICQRINNYNDCVNIIASLNTLQIRQLKKTWEIVFKNVYISNLFKELNFLCSYTKNYENIRNEIKLVKGHPCIPYLGLYLKELAFLDEGPKYVTDKNLINIEKIEKVGEKLKEIKEFQSIPYVYLPVIRLAFLADPQPKREEILLQISSKLEPKYTLNSTKSIRKRPTNTDLTSHELNETFKELIREISKEKFTNF